MAFVNDVHSSPYPLRWRHNERNGVSNHQPHDCLLNFLFRRRSKKTSKLRATGLCAGNSPIPTQRASNAENVFIWWRNHAMCILKIYCLMCRVLVESSHDYHSLSVKCQGSRPLVKSCFPSTATICDFLPFWRPRYHITTSKVATYMDNVIMD